MNVGSPCTRGPPPQTTRSPPPSPSPSTRSSRRASGVNAEDLVEILGEVRAPEAVEPIRSLVQERRDFDWPFFSFCIKGIQVLGEISTPDALQFLRNIAASEPGTWPDPLRWYAADELDIVDELGFDEGQMLSGS